MLWRKFLARYSHGNDALFGSAFLERWDKEKWSPNAEDKKAAAKAQDLQNKCLTPVFVICHSADRVKSVGRLHPSV
jgi:hypothetical protein